MHGRWSGHASTCCGFPVLSRHQIEHELGGITGLQEVVQPEGKFCPFSECRGCLKITRQALALEAANIDLHPEGFNRHFADCRIHSLTPAGGVDAGTMLKHDLQSTGLPCVGLKGTVVSEPHTEHLVLVSGRILRPKPPRFALHLLQRNGSFANPLSEKKSCSPAVKTNSAEQSTHINTLSVNCIAGPSNRNQRDLNRKRESCRS